MCALGGPSVTRSCRWVDSIFRCGLGLFLLWSGLSNIRRPYDVLGNVYEYELVGPKVGLLVAMVVPWLQLLLGVCVVAGVFVGGAFLISVMVLGAGIIAQASAVCRDLDVRCRSCQLISGDAIGWVAVGYTSVLFLAAAAGYSLFLLRRPSLARRTDKVS